MSVIRPNKQMFALPGPPPAKITLAGRQYKIRKVFKHDFFAATWLYENGSHKAVVKFGREGPFWGLPMAWMGQAMRRREERIYSRLGGVEGVPKWLGRFGQTGYAIEYIDAVPLDHLDKPEEGFFDSLLAVMEAVHSRGVGYMDANKRSNILVGPDGRAYLVDFQISVRSHDNWPWPWNKIMRACVDYVAQRDIYHVLKHKRRLMPESLTAGEEAISRRRGPLHTIHRKLTKPWRRLRRGILQALHAKGRLVSPSAGLEDHYQPEKATWRKGDEVTTDEGDGSR